MLLKSQQNNSFCDFYKAVSDEYRVIKVFHSGQF